MNEEKKVPFKWEYGEETISPVSYTHLDVYKRQSEGSDGKHHDAGVCA